MINDNNVNGKESQQVIRRPSFTIKMQRSFKKMKKSIQKITESSTTVQPHYVFVENLHDDEKHPPYIFPERLSTLTRQTGFSRDEIRQLYRYFKQYCPRGTATTNDLKPAYAKIFPLGEAGKYAQIVFNSFDKNGDGVITFGDLLHGIAIIIHGDVEQKLAWIFRFYDLNDDGRITRRDMMIIMTAIYEMVNNGQSIQRIINRHVDRFFEKMDIDKDGVISKEEFIVACKNDRVIHDQLLEFSNIW